MAGFYKHSICNRLSLVIYLPLITILHYKFKVFVHLNKKQTNNINPLINRNYENRI